MNENINTDIKMKTTIMNHYLRSLIKQKKKEKKQVSSRISYFDPPSVIGLDLSFRVFDSTVSLENFGHSHIIITVFIKS